MHQWSDLAPPDAEQPLSSESIVLFAQLHDSGVSDLRSGILGQLLPFTDELRVILLKILGRVDELLLRASIGEQVLSRIQFFFVTQMLACLLYTNQSCV